MENLNFTQVKFPCKGCQKRKPGCHAECEKYKKAREAADEIIRQKQETVRKADENRYFEELKRKRIKRYTS